MRDLVQKLPSVSPQHDHGTSDDTIALVLATLNEVIKKHPEFSRYGYTVLSACAIILGENVAYSIRYNRYCNSKLQIASRGGWCR